MTSIRIATQNDCQAIADLAIAFRNHLQRSAPSDEAFRESIAQLIAAEDAEFYLCTWNQQPVGYVLQRFRYSMWAHGTEATLEDLFVHPEARKAGIGRKLVQFALARVKEKQCRSVCLDTNEHNAGSTRIYASLGFSAFSNRWKGNQLFFRMSLT